jgi:adenosine deaminase
MPPQVFAELLVGFELAAVDPRVVGVNLVGREDAAPALRDIELHMSMLEYLHSVYPSVPIALHAGELLPGQVTPVDNCCHVRLAVERGGASRIGHGVDILSEEDPGGLMSEMASAGLLVEIMLTSNAQILGVQGQSHPLLEYLRAGVPVALASDDEGVLRTDLTHEYMRAAQEFGLTYLELKTMARNSVSYSFLATSARAHAQSRLEAGFVAFESQF